MNKDLLSTPIEYLKGVGPQRGEAFKTHLQIFTYADLLQYFPYRYIDKTRVYGISEITEDMQWVQICGTIVEVNEVGHKRARRLVATLADASGMVELVWFQGLKWISSSVSIGKKYLVFGKPALFKGSYSFTHPELEIYQPEMMHTLSKFEPMYPSGEKLKARGLDSKGIARVVQTLLEIVQHAIPEILPAGVISSMGLCPRKEAFLWMHFPKDQAQLNQAIHRLKFEELFMVQLRMLRSRQIRLYQNKGFVFDKVGEVFHTFYHEHLPFPLTEAQKRVIREIRSDMGSGRQMNRLLQGDVGSGKTLVALMCMLIAIDNGFQCALMAPTEILATQHFHTFRELLSKMPVQTGLLTGSTKPQARPQLQLLLDNGMLNMLIGTHALIEEQVKFQNLGLVIIDEQHRFGVEQRSKLWQKNDVFPHVLVMTATPIPRTLAMTMYGDLDTSVIDEMPGGRKPIITSHRYDAHRLSVFGFIKQQIEQGRQAYIVYPLIEESEKLDFKDLMDGYESVVRAFPPPVYRVGILHGRMKSADKDFEMQRFASGETQIMVATTVIEVGVNVPNATVMVIESAEKFGLSQLHQLRGRVGRGGNQSYCILLTSDKLNPDARKRIETMVRTNDGFEIAETDLALRGPGDMQGTRQSGAVDLKLCDLSKDGELIAQSREVARALLANDPMLQHPEHQSLLLHLKTQENGRLLWSRVS
ncbi:MAG: ATP-dependent DNA helicase RecG [Bacteroidota bacterium]